MTGTVKSFVSKKGYGFITLDSNGTDVFCHWSAIVAHGFKSLDPGDRVQLDVLQGSKGLYAANVIRISNASSVHTAETNHTVRC